MLRHRTTEVMVWVLTNRDRKSTLDMPCSIPIAYVLQTDYSSNEESYRSCTTGVHRKRPENFELCCTRTVDPDDV